MKITRNTPDQLILERKPFWLPLLFIAVFLLFFGIGLFVFSEEPILGTVFMLLSPIGLVFAIIFGQRVQIILHRSAGTVTIQRRSLVRYKRTSLLLEEVKSVIVETSHMTNKDGTQTEVYRLAFDTVIGPRPVSKTYTNVGDPFDAAKIINDWLDSPPPQT